MRTGWRWRLTAVVGGVSLAAPVTLGLGVHPATAAGSFIAPVAVPNATVSEPGVNVGPDGAIYINGPAGLLSNLPGSPSPVFKSTDGGATWVTTPLSGRANLPGGGDSNISIDPTTNKLYMTDLWLGSDTVARSTDDATTWTASPLSGVVLEDRQWVAAAGDGDVYHLTHQVPAGLVVSKSVAPTDGLIYPISTVAATVVDQTGCVCPPGNLIAEPGGLLGDKVGFVYATSTGGVNFAFSTNGGLTFTQSTVQPASSFATDNNFPVVADAGNGQLVAVWLNDGASSSEVSYSLSPNFGASWSAPAVLVGSGGSVYPWVAAKGSQVSVSLYHTSTVTNPDNAPAGTVWNETYLESLSGGAPGTWSALTTIDPTPSKAGPVCTGGTNCTSDRDLGDFQTVTIDNAGRANVSYDRVTASGDQVMFDRQM